MQNCIFLIMIFWVLKVDFEWDSEKKNDRIFLWKIANRTVPEGVGRRTVLGESPRLRALRWGTLSQRLFLLWFLFSSCLIIPDRDCAEQRSYAASFRSGRFWLEFRAMTSGGGQQTLLGKGLRSCTNLPSTKRQMKQNFWGEGWHVCFKVIEEEAEQVSKIK